MLNSARDPHKAYREFQIRGGNPGSALAVVLPPRFVGSQRRRAPLSRQIGALSVPEDLKGMRGFVKIYGNRLLNSSLMDTSVATRWAFTVILAGADETGFFRCATPRALARTANITIRQANRAIEELEAPDPESTSKEDGGRRIKRVSGGWDVVNFDKYREYRTKKQLTDAERSKRYRDKRDASRLSHDESHASRSVAPEAEAEAEAEAEREEQRASSSNSTPSLALTPQTSEASSLARTKNPYRFIAYWQDANEERDYGIKLEPPGLFGQFVEEQARELGIAASPPELSDMTRRWVTKFAAHYSKRDRRGKTRGARCGPKRLTEELVAWVRSDLATFASRVQKSQTGAKTFGELEDERMARMIRDAKERDEGRLGE